MSRARLLSRVRALLPLDSPEPPRCLVCQRPVTERDARIRVRGEAVVHRACATYRMRQPRAEARRVADPPR
jgi:hypothetical protein